MSSIVERLLHGRTRKTSRHRKRFLDRLFSKRSLVKHRDSTASLISSKKQKSKRIFSILKGSKRKKRSDNKQVDKFIHWCGCVGLDLHPNVCAKYRVFTISFICHIYCLSYWKWLQVWQPDTCLQGYRSGSRNHVIKYGGVPHS